MKLEFALPWPPSVNQYWRQFRGRTLVSAAGRAYKKEVCLTIPSRFKKMLNSRLRINLVAHPPDKRRRDLDNLLKSLLDSIMAAGVYVDDSQIDELLIKRAPYGELCGGIIFVEIEEINL